MTIRHATEADTPRLVEMATRFLLETRYGELFDHQATPDTIAKLVADVLALGVIFVAVVNDAEDSVWSPRLVGMLAIVALPHPLTGRIYADEIAWWVEPAHRCGSIGPKLLWAAEAWATRSGANMVKFVAPAGSSVGGFYERMGYRPVETAYLKSI